MKIIIDLEDSFFEKKDKFYFYMWCIKKAASEDKNVVFRGKKVSLNRGEFVTSLNSIVAETGIKKWKVRTLIKDLEKSKKVRTKLAQSSHTFIVVDYDKYQHVTTNSEDSSAQSSHKVSTKQEDIIYSSYIYNKIKKEKNSKEKKKSVDFEREIKDYVKSFMDHVYSQNPKLAPKGENVFTNSCAVISRLINIDGFTMAYISEVVEWALNDSFWSSNVRSLASLRNKKNGTTKFQNIATRYEASNKTTNVSNKTNKTNNLTLIQSILDTE